MPPSLALGLLPSGPEPKTAGLEHRHREQRPKPNGLGSNDDRGGTISRILQLPAIALAADAGRLASSASCPRLLRTSFIHCECTSSHL